MARVKRGTVSKRKHNKLNALTKGYRGTKRRLVKKQHESVLHAGAYAFHGRKLRKRDIRSLWNTRISEASKIEGTSYSKLIHALKEAKVDIDRKILADLVVNDPQTFAEIVKQTKAN